jgi:hypothetical protein
VTARKDNAMTVIVSRHRFAPDDVWPITCRHCGRRADAHVNEHQDAQGQDHKHEPRP